MEVGSTCAVVFLMRILNLDEAPPTNEISTFKIIVFKETLSAGEDIKNAFI